VTDPLVVLNRLLAATNDHDLDRLVDCFSEDYVNETPVHPDRSFRGNAQVHQNWARIFEFVPDVRATALASSVAGAEVWSEWEMRGTRPDGSLHLMRGVIIFGVAADRIVRARFYLEPAEDGGGKVDEFVRGQVGAT
jgi:ketosteroid isomerase-like protein